MPKNEKNNSTSFGGIEKELPEGFSGDAQPSGATELKEAAPARVIDPNTEPKLEVDNKVLDFSKPISEAPEWARTILENQQKLQDTITANNAEIERLRTDNSMFREFAGKNTIKGWEDSKKDHTQKFVHFKMWEDKTIVGWDKLDRSEFNRKADTAVEEKLFLPIHFADGSNERLNYIDFVNIKDLRLARLLKFTQERSLVEFEDGVQIELDTRFLNP